MQNEHYVSADILPKNFLLCGYISITGILVEDWANRSSWSV